MRQITKTIAAVLIILGHVVAALALKLVVRNRRQLRGLYLSLAHRNCRRLLAVMGIRVEIAGREHLRPGQNYFMVSNHMSYLDAVMMAALRPAGFVTSMEMKEAPVLGLLTEVGGCLYVERRSRDNLSQEIGEIEEALRQRFNVVVFPEATSTDGTKVLPFKRPLFAAAARAGVPVLPMVVEYVDIDGRPVTPENRDTVCWYGKMSFAPHFVGIMRHRRIRARLKILPEIPITADSNRDNLMEAAYERISSNYQPIS
jgi:1-acyl-sn-glycerol-3-phosphate acyltransferase